MRILLFIAILIVSFSSSAQQLDWQGHRGCRGLMPENTVPAFIKALELGVTTLELDLAVSKDGILVVTHEPWLNPNICLDANGSSLKGKSESQLNLYEMDYREIEACDCGSLPYGNFPRQAKVKASKPTLAAVIHAAENYKKEHNLPDFNYNIEIKSDPKGDNIFHPTPEAFSKLVHEFLSERLPLSRYNIQSFDFRVLKVYHKMYPDTQLAALLESKMKPENLEAELGFMPEIYSSYHLFLRKKMVKAYQKKGVKVIPWTVNTQKRVNKMIKYGVDGIITDYPDLKH